MHLQHIGFSYHCPLKLYFAQFFLWLRSTLPLQTCVLNTEVKRSRQPEFQVSFSPEEKTDLTSRQGDNPVTANSDKTDVRGNP